MNRSRRQKTRRVAFNPRHGLTYEDLHSLINILQKMVDSLDYGTSRRRPRARSVKCQTTIPAAPSNPRGALNMGVNYDRKEVPIFQTYEEFHKTVLRPFENISIILSTDGKVVFISQNVSPLLGHHPEDIVGKTLLNILLDEEKEEIAQKIILNPPLAKSVGSLIEFYCHVRKINSGLLVKDEYNYVDIYDRRDTYEYVKFVLYLKDSYDESFVIFGNCGRRRRNIRSSTPRLLREQQYHLMGTISVLCTRAESEQPAAIQPPVRVIDSYDDNNTQCQRLQKQCKRKKIQGKHQPENLNAQSPESSSDVEIVDVIPAPQQTPFELAQVRTLSRSSICSTISHTSMTTSISSSGDFAAIASTLVVTIINDLGAHPFNFFRNGNFVYPRIETHRFWDDHVDHNSPVLHGSSTRSYQTTLVPYQPGAAVTNQPVTGTHQPSAMTQYPPPRSHLSTSDYTREGRPHFVPPGQENPRYFHPEEDIDPHP